MRTMVALALEFAGAEFEASRASKLMYVGIAQAEQQPRASGYV